MNYKQRCSRKSQICGRHFCVKDETCCQTAMILSMMDQKSSQKATKTSKSCSRTYGGHALLTYRTMRSRPIMFTRWWTTLSTVNRRWLQSSWMVCRNSVPTSTLSGGRSRTLSLTGRCTSLMPNKSRNGVPWPPRLGRRSIRRQPTTDTLMNHNSLSPR